MKLQKTLHTALAFTLLAAGFTIPVSIASAAQACTKVKPGSVWCKQEFTYKDNQITGLANNENPHPDKPVDLPETDKNGNKLETVTASLISSIEGKTINFPDSIIENIDPQAAKGRAVLKTTDTIATSNKPVSEMTEDETQDEIQRLLAIQAARNNGLLDYPKPKHDTSKENLNDALNTVINIQGVNYDVTRKNGGLVFTEKMVARAAGERAASGSCVGKYDSMTTTHRPYHYANYQSTFSIGKDSRLYESGSTGPDGNVTNMMSIPNAPNGESSIAKAGDYFTIMAPEWVEYRGINDVIEDPYIYDNKTGEIIARRDIIMMPALGTNGNRLIPQGIKYTYTNYVETHINIKYSETIGYGHYAPGKTRGYTNKNQWVSCKRTPATSHTEVGFGSDVNQQHPTSLGGAITSTDTAINTGGYASIKAPLISSARLIPTTVQFILSQGTKTNLHLKFDCDKIMSNKITGMNFYGNSNWFGAAYTDANNVNSPNKRLIASSDTVDENHMKVMCTADRVDITVPKMPMKFGYLAINMPFSGDPVPANLRGTSQEVGYLDVRSNNTSDALGHNQMLLRTIPVAKSGSGDIINKTLVGNIWSDNDMNGEQSNSKAEPQIDGIKTVLAALDSNNTINPAGDKYYWHSEYTTKRNTTTRYGANRVPAGFFEYANIRPGSYKLYVIIDKTKYKFTNKINKLGSGNSTKISNVVAPDDDPTLTNDTRVFRPKLAANEELRAIYVNTRATGATSPIYIDAGVVPVNTNRITGTVFLDSNENGELDSNEKIIDKALTKIEAVRPCATAISGWTKTGSNCVKAFTISNNQPANIVGTARANKYNYRLEDISDEDVKAIKSFNVYSSIPADYRPSKINTVVPESVLIANAINTNVNNTSPGAVRWTVDASKLVHRYAFPNNTTLRVFDIGLVLPEEKITVKIPKSGSQAKLLITLSGIALLAGSGIILKLRTKRKEQ